MKLVHIVGRQNNGKTTLVIDLISELNNRGLNVGTIKHSRNDYELDKPGKDSYLHSAAGGNPSAIMTANQVAIFISRKSNENPLEKITPLFDDTDLVIIEGYIDGPGKKIEVWREEAGSQPLFLKRNDIEAVITNDSIDTDLPVWPRNDIINIVNKICKITGIKT